MQVHFRNRYLTKAYMQIHFGTWYLTKDVVEQYCRCVKYLFPKMARLSTDVLRQVPICRIRPHGRHLPSTCFQNAPALTPFVRYLFPKCACMDVNAVHGHPSSSTYLQNSPAWLSMDILRQIPISKMHLQYCSRTSFVKYQVPK